MINHSGEWLSLGGGKCGTLVIEIFYFLIRLWVYSFICTLYNKSYIHFLSSLA